MTASTTPSDPAALARELFENYDRYKKTEITTRRFTHAELMQWLKQFEEQKVVESSPAGKSGEGRMIPLLKFGNGQTKALLWSQMHGDEPTATMALVDMLNFFAQEPDHVVTKTIREKLTLLIIPMLNPDGAERFQRRSVHGIDINRDALRLQTSEARILKATQEKYKPEFGFNLHDQDPRYTVGSSKNVTAIALLAPSLDEKKTETPSVKRAKHVAATFAEVLNVFVQGHLARYDDAFEPRAFGDNVQKWGTSTILVESGGWKDDREKMFLRKLNYVGLLTSLYVIATGAYQEAKLELYERLPFNGKNLYDVIVRRAKVTQKNAPEITVDIGINVEEQKDPANGNIQLVGKIVDIGDLSSYGAFEEIDGSQIPALTGEQVKLEKTLTVEKGKKLF
ncbi:MAG: peptidase M14 [Ignavibacteriae bacterium]|nr:peptidase M14 [Ignavibacteriota bacterium]